jgi:hypothetical protein
MNDFTLSKGSLNQPSAHTEEVSAYINTITETEHAL